MNCPRCKTTVTQQDKYCPSCGLPLEAARSGGAAVKKPAGKSKAYEEASTQLVDVDEFRKYMAGEQKGGANLAAGAPPAGAGNLAGGANLAAGAPPAAAPRNLAGSPAPDPDMVATRKVDPIRSAPPAPDAVSPAASRTDDGEFGVQKRGSPMMMGIIAVAVIVVGFLVWRMFLAG